MRIKGIPRPAQPRRKLVNGNDPASVYKQFVEFAVSLFHLAIGDLPDRQDELELVLEMKIKCCPDHARPGGDILNARPVISTLTKNLECSFLQSLFSEESVLFPYWPTATLFRCWPTATGVHSVSAHRS